jgi:hypothetical protein
VQTGSGAISGPKTRLRVRAGFTLNPHRPQLTHPARLVFSELVKFSFNTAHLSNVLATVASHSLPKFFGRLIIYHVVADLALLVASCPSVRLCRNPSICLTVRLVNKSAIESTLSRHPHYCQNTAMAPASGRRRTRREAEPAQNDPGEPVVETPTRKRRKVGPRNSRSPWLTFLGKWRCQRRRHTWKPSIYARYSSCSNWLAEQKCRHQASNLCRHRGNH